MTATVLAFWNKIQTHKRFKRMRFVLINNVFCPNKQHSFEPFMCLDLEWKWVWMVSPLFCIWSPNWNKVIASIEWFLWGFTWPHCLHLDFQILWATTVVCRASPTRNRKASFITWPTNWAAFSLVIAATLISVRRTITTISLIRLLTNLSSWRHGAPWMFLLVRMRTFSVLFDGWLTCLPVLLWIFCLFFVDHPCIV